jgi:predicted enzyme related to lactoylglutathione lyase
LKSAFIIYVKDQSASRKFYSAVLNIEPVLDVPGMTEFSLNDYTVLGLMPEDGIVKVLGKSVPHPKDGSGVPRCEMYLHVDSPDEYIERLIEAGGRLISKKQLRDWGDETAYGIDPDGHVLAFAKTKSGI